MEKGEGKGDDAVYAIPERLRLAVFRFRLTPTEPMDLPRYKGAVLRGGFGTTFKRLVCIQRDPATCTPCRLGNVCPYGYVFETSPPEGSEVLSNLSDVPTPFVLEPPADTRTWYEPGEHLDFDLVLVGRGIQYLPYFLAVFEALGEAGLGRRRARFNVERVEAVQPLSGERAAVFAAGDERVRGETKSVTSGEVAAEAARLPAARLTLRFLTPTRLKHRDHFVSQPEFHVVVRSLLRRVSSLAYFHGGELWETDFRGIIEAAEAVRTARQETRWVDWERYSTRQGQRMNLGGFVGEATYEGELGPFRPLLALGALIHVGKAAVFGNGKYDFRF